MVSTILIAESLLSINVNTVAINFCGAPAASPILPVHSAAVVLHFVEDEWEDFSLFRGPFKSVNSHLMSHFKMFVWGWIIAVICPITNVSIMAVICSIKVKSTIVVILLNHICHIIAVICTITYLCLILSLIWYTLKASGHPTFSKKDWWYESNLRNSNLKICPLWNNLLIKMTLFVTCETNCLCKDWVVKYLWQDNYGSTSKPLRVRIPVK